MLSVTMLSGYLYCPRKLYLERVLKLSEPPKEALVKGTIRHETYDLINKNEEKFVTRITEKPQLDALTELYKNQYLKYLRIATLHNKEGLKQFNLNPGDLFKQVYPLIVDEALVRSQKLFAFIEKHDVFGKELWDKLTPKILSELQITSPSLGLKGIIDQIEVYGENMVPFELKTGKTPREGVWPGHKIQIAAYALLLEFHYNNEVKEGFVRYLDSKQLRHISINPFMRMEVRELIKKVTFLLAQKQLPPYCESKGKCQACGLRQTCYDEKAMKQLMENKSLEENQKL
ncbi:MAG TPA: CRISPR-associated protein Cas4 [Candidatus Nanoarchaeia archaeon]|nr:CRISPR-associated protein Cas4 [Candidatus Nanoarchaeia archaeon]